ncbi:DUF4148 domain-containing protein [Paraburkholderia madseniana]|uniref:DUF4148 domain-containing protein n=1 Tax=Paraburkholderia madseniana TaxID=2599607 RepID=A0A6N6WEE7_9BURK|nr:DUF4148 domain-containing protein [Paraburkholderia madseniana]KAE8757860.1 DUF4148 domain-containing protein [Paraburkholderia madseniana]
MKTLRLVATCAVALIFGQAWAQDNPVQSATPPAAQDVGGTTSSSAGESGSAAKLTRQQVYQDLIRSRQSGEQSRLWGDLYHGQ